MEDLNMAKKIIMASTIVFLVWIILLSTFIYHPSHAEEMNAIEIERIVSLAPSNTEILFALGLGEKVVGVTDYCNYPEEAKKKEKIGGYSTIDIEKVVSLKPDLVLAAYGNGEEVVERLKELGINVAIVSPKPVKGIEDTLKEIRYVGKISGKETEASSLCEEMEKKIKDITDKTRDAKKVRVAHICWHEPFYVAGSECLQSDMIKKAGGENVFSDVEGWHTVSMEELIDRNPDVIIVSSGTGMGGEENVAYDYILGEARLKCINAVKNHRVYLIDADIVSRSGPRIADVLEEVVKFIHSELFETYEVMAHASARA
jgi:ABC-type Fe3+-hydroxamate transport system, periplasmic component